MTTKKIIFAAALLAGTMTTSWAAVGDLTETKPIATLTMTASQAFESATNIAFNNITIDNCYDYDASPYTNRILFKFVFKTNSSISNVNIAYRGVMTPGGTGDINAENNRILYTLYRMPKAGANSETFSAKTGGTAINGVDAVKPAGGQDLTIQSIGIRSNQAGNNVSTTSPYYTIAGYAQVTSDAATLCALEPASRAETITLTVEAEA